MKWLKKVAATPLTSIAKVIDDFSGVIVKDGKFIKCKAR